METASSKGYSEALSLGRLKPGQYFTAAQEAGRRLGWHLVAVQQHTLVFITPGVDYYFVGEVVTVTVQEQAIFFESAPRDSFYKDESQNERNAASFKDMMATIAAEIEKADRSIHPMHREKFGALLPSKTYFVTPVLVYLNALVLLVMILAGISPTQPTAESLFEWGGISRQAVVGGDWWRLFTYMFLHGGIVHLAGNIWALLYVGMFLEPLIGKFRLISAYVLTGICAGLLSIVMHPDSVGVGASGAIFGLYGIFLAMLTTSHIEKTMRRTMLRSILLFVVFNLMMGLKGNVDNAAHIGGLVSGFLIGYVYYPGVARHASFRSQLLTTIMSASVVFVLMLFVLTRFQ
jgi:rhomboid protease GluP